MNSDPHLLSEWSGSVTEVELGATWTILGLDGPISLRSLDGLNHF